MADFADAGATGTPPPRVRWSQRLKSRDARSTAALTDQASGTDRRSFLRTSGGYAASAALVGVPATVLLEPDADAATAAPKVTANPTSPPPNGPTMAYVHNVKEGTVVIVSGETERTVRDHDLVHKLLNAPAAKKPRRTATKKKAR